MVKKSEISTVMRALVKKRWAKTSKEERSKELSKVAKARWAKRGEEKHGER
jgi:predicted transcriptional regulator